MNQQKTIKNRILFLLLLILMGFTGCGDKNESHTTDDTQDITQIVLTTGFEKDEIFRIGKSSCYKDEYMVYLINMQNHYESVYGKEIWSISNGEISMEERVKENVAERIAQVKIMNLLAEEYQVTLSTEEEKLVSQAARKYYSSLNEAEIEAMDITEERLADIYEEYQISHKVYAYIIRDINPEISDDEARSVTVDWIFFRSLDENTEIENNAKMILQQIRDGEEFGVLASVHSEDQIVSHTFGKGMVDPAIEECAFDLSEGEVSEVIKGAEGYYILYCTSPLDREETDINKEVIITKRKREAFNEVYGTFAGEQIKQINQEQWQNMSMPHDESITTNTFFEVYEQYFPQDEDAL